MRSKSMQALTDAWKRRHPGVVIYGVGDPDHQKRRSGHNEDDTPGSLPEMEDADNIPEHRALDGMLGPAFSKADAYTLIDDILGNPADRDRLIYIIFDGWIWSASRGWERREFDGDPHDDHVHASGDAADDDNDAPWLEDDMTDLSYDPRQKPKAVGDRSAATLIADIWGQEAAGKSPVDGDQSFRTKQLVRIETKLDELLKRPPVQAGPVDVEAVRAVVRAELDKTRLAGG